MRILHCSDVHITADYARLPWRRLGWRRWLALLELGPGGRARDFASAATTLAAIARDFERHGADHLVLSGDLTAYALAQEFSGAREALGSLAESPARCTVIPGNHDTFTPGSVRSRRFEAQFGHLLESDIEGSAVEGPYPFVRLLGDEVAVIGMHSARVPRLPGFAQGWLGHRQLQALRDLLQDRRLANRAVLVVVHHAPLTPRGRPDGRLHGLSDGAKLLSLLPGPRFAVLHGHLHHRHHHVSDGVRPHLIGAGSSTQYGREGYWLIDVEDGVVRRVQAARPEIDARKEHAVTPTRSWTASPRPS